jgi:hypothetical protein
MENQLKPGQIVRFKEYKKKELEPEAYFIVLTTENENNKCWLQVINSNREYETQTAIVPLYLDDIEVVEVQAKELVFQEVTIKEGLYNDFVSDYVHSVDDEESYLKFTAVDGGFESNAIYTMSTEILNGKIFAKMPDFLKQ